MAKAADLNNLKSLPEGIGHRDHSGVVVEALVIPTPVVPDEREVILV